MNNTPVKPHGSAAHQSGSAAHQKGSAAHQKGSAAQSGPAREQLRDLIKGLNDSVAILEAHRDVTRQINKAIIGRPITAEEFAAAIVSPQIVMAIKIKIQMLRDPELFSEPHHD